MQKLFILFIILFLSSSNCFSAPGFDPNNNKPIIYDMSYNHILYFKLKDYFYKKYPEIVTKDKDGYPLYIDTAPFGAYHDEVEIPYDLIKLSEEELNILNASKKSQKELLKDVIEDITYYNELNEKYNKTCNPGRELYKKKLEELGQKGLYNQAHKNKLENEMIANGTLCSTQTWTDMVYTPLHDRRMKKLKK